MAVPERKSSSHSPTKVLTTAQEVAVRLYVAGYDKPKIAEKMLYVLYPGSRKWKRGKKKRAIKVVKEKLDQWEQRQWFRDSVWERTLVSTEVSLPKIMNAVVAEAEDGDIMAARLALEVTGRHNPRGQEQTPAVVNINLGGVARPQSRALPEGVDLTIEDAEIVEEPE